MSKELVRHCVLRFSLGSVLIWFGCLQVMAPADWVSFIPPEIAGPAPLAPTTIILWHGLGLILAGLGLTFGVLLRPASLLAAVLLGEIIAALALLGWQDNSGLIVRDVALWAMAVVLGMESAPERSVSLAEGSSSAGFKRMGNALEKIKISCLPK